MRLIYFSDARNKLKSVLDQIIDDADHAAIIRRDADDAVVISLEPTQRKFVGLLVALYRCSNRLLCAVDDNKPPLISCRYHYDKPHTIALDYLI
jgi:hypothetical protein